MTGQEVRFVRVTGGRVAVATVGSGPPLVLPGLWISHVELEWEFPAFRGFVERLAAAHTVVRYDRLGVGLSDRDAAPPDTGTEAARLAELTDALGLDRFALLGMSWGGCVALEFAATWPERVERVVTVGVPVRGADVAPEPLREALLGTVLAHWGAGSRLLADIWIPGADGPDRERFARLQRAAAGAEAATAALRAVYAADVTALLGRVVAPVLVTHRRDDRAVPFAAARELAAGIDGARLVALPGEAHPPWVGDAESVLAAVLPFLSGTEEPREPLAAPPGGPLSTRELEVLRLVAAGRSDAEIAAELQLSPHTVHRHMANVRTKLDQPSRAAAVAHAGRLGLL